jgi:hypothetical protein
MVIVTEFGCLVHEYAERCSDGVFPRPSECPHCRVVDTLIGHGFYERKALSSTQVYVLRIKRWYCTACQRTVSLLPSFLLRFRHYLLDVIQSAISSDELTGDCLLSGWTCTTTFSGKTCTGAVKSPEKHTFTMHPGGHVCSNTKKCSVTIKFSEPPTHCPWSFTY